MPAPLLCLEHFSYAYDTAGEWVLREICLDAYPGQCHCLSGPNGSGKTTLLMAIRSLLPEGRQSGKCSIANHHSGAGIVMQNPQIQLIGVSLGAEVAFGLENHCVPPPLMPGIVRSMLQKVGLWRPLHTPVAKLSMGQQYRTCLAGILVMGPDLILMDEPVSQLDPQGVEQLKSAIDILKSDGKAVIICDHRPEALEPVVDHHWALDRYGRMAPRSKKPSRQNGAGRERDITSTRFSPSFVAKSRKEIGRRTGVGSRIADYKTVLHLKEVVPAPSPPASPPPATISFELARGETAVVIGPNGSGKTSLVRCLAGLCRPGGGSIEVFCKSPDPGELRGRVGVLFQNPEAQLFETTVFDEVAFAARRHGPAPFNDDHVHRLLELLDLSNLAEIPPHRLSYGQKRLVGLAAVAAGNPELLILDDPLAGLDRSHARNVTRLLSHLNTAHGTTILCTSHHPEILATWAHHTIALNHHPSVCTRDRSADDIDAREVDRGRMKMPAGATLATGVVLSMMAFASRGTPMLASLTGVNLLLVLLWCPKPRNVLVKSVKLFLWQSLIIAVLYGLRFGWHDGFLSGLHVAWQLFNAIWPGIIVSNAISFSRSTRALSRILPNRTAFVAATCLRFLPMLLSEMAAIRQGQLFRGARLLPGDLKNPRYWPDWLRCLMVPTLVRTLSLSTDISTAATARDFGMYPKRTHWPEET